MKIVGETLIGLPEKKGCNKLMLPPKLSGPIQ